MGESSTRCHICKSTFLHDNDLYSKFTCSIEKKIVDLRTHIKDCNEMKGKVKEVLKNSRESHLNKNKLSIDKKEDFNPLVIHSNDNHEIKSSSDISICILGNLKSLKREKQNILENKKIISEDTRNHILVLSKFVNRKRLENALNLFTCIPVVPGIISNPNRKLSLNGLMYINGCSTISSLPLQNNGNYDGTPFHIVAAALLQISHLANSVAIALNITLPHKMTPFGIINSAICPQYNNEKTYYLTPVFYDDSNLKSPKFSFNTIGEIRKLNEVTLSKKTGFFKDDPNYILNESFTEALLLLRANIISLCIHGGVPISRLWPPEALLLNLCELNVLIDNSLKIT